MKFLQSKEIVIGLPRFRIEDMHKVCEACQLGKQTKHAFPQDRHVSRNVLEIVHYDVWGLAKTTSMGGCKYYVTFIDDHTRKVWVYFMKEKSEVFTHFQNFRVMVEKQTRKQVKCLRSDGGGEYFSSEFSGYLQKDGIETVIMRNTPQQNSVAERKNRHIAKIACTLMVAEKNMRHSYWVEAVSTVVYIMNMTPTATIHDVTSEEKFTGNKPDLSHLKVFGCIAYVHVLDELRTKLDPKAEKCVFIGYSLEQKGYMCYNLATHELRVSRDVVFDDEKSNWYAAERAIGADVSESVVAQDVSQQSQTFSEPGESSSGAKSDNRPWSGRTRSQTNSVGTKNVSRNGKEKVNEGLVLPDISAGHSVVDGESSGLDMSLDNELGIPSMKMHGVKKAL